MDDYSRYCESEDKAKRLNLDFYKGTISNLFINNLNKDKHQYVLVRKINEYRFLNIRSSELILVIKDILEKYYKEEINYIGEIKKFK